jgi:hypothetical protein
VTVLKPKRTRHFKFRTGRRQVEPMTERKITYLGTITTLEPGEKIALDVPLDADAARIAAAIGAANAERVAAQVRESRRLRRIFLEEDEPHE